MAPRLQLLGIPTISMTMTIVATVSERTKFHDEYYLVEGDLLLTIEIGHTMVFSFRIFDVTI